MPKDRNTGEARDDLSEQLQALSGHLRAKKSRPCHIPAWSRKAGDQPVGDWIGHAHRDDGGCARCLLGRERCGRTKRDNDIGLAHNQFSGQPGEPIHLPSAYCRSIARFCPSV
jgi:hypothetical protein